jgi:two-component system, NtrC family, response regulator AtoC
MPKILIVDDEKNTREGLRMALSGRYQVFIAHSATEAFDLFKEDFFDIVLTDLRMNGPSGMAVIDKALSLPEKPICIMMTAFGDVDTAVEAMRKGAYDFLTKPVNLGKLELAIERALKVQHLTEQKEELQERLEKTYRKDNLVGDSLKMKQTLASVEKIAPSKATVLIQGETGTGKELIARLIHERSPRAKNPFVAVHCSALASNLLESELFGYEKGAFTGANQRRIGRFEAAQSGTLFLDEIGEIDEATQVKLLRFLETRTLERLGSNESITLDVRLVAATHRDLMAEVKAGRFREDLYYRLSVVPIALPSLRERSKDIPLLLDHYLNLFAKENRLPIPRLDPKAQAVLMNYRWPGNIRELRNLCENFVVTCSNGHIGIEDLPKRLSEKPSEVLVSFEEKTLPKGGNKLAEEKAAIREGLRKASGNKTEAAELLGMSRRTLHRKLSQWPEIEE